MKNLYKKNQMTLKEIERFMDAKRKREAKARAEREKKMFEAAEAVGTVIDGEIWDFGPEC